MTSEGGRRRSGARQRPLTVLMVASEMTPFAKTGGLADVIGALPRALASLGHQVTVVMPRYRAEGGRLLSRLTIPLAGTSLEVGRFETVLGSRARVWELDAPSLYAREGLYGTGSVDYPDNARRFAVLALAAIEAARRHDPPADVLHAHDWQGGLAPLYLRLAGPGDGALAGVRSIFTIHNLAYQGLCSLEAARDVGLPAATLQPEGIEYWGRASFLKAGINYADIVTTVSRTYAREILTSELGFGFDGILRARARDLVGVANGIDTDVWDPARDPALPVPFSADDLEGKRAAKREALSRFGLPVDAGSMGRPLVGMISRLVDQKGFDLLATMIPGLLSLPATYVLLGSGETRHEALWRDVAARHPERVGVVIGFDERLAHLVEGGADVFLMPSRFEPCGLNQLYSLAYGTVPVVRATGGLADTVRDFDERTGTGTGFTFRRYTEPALMRALGRALAVFGQPDRWRGIQLAGMREDHSWTVSAREYVKVYGLALQAAGRRPRPGEPGG